MSGLVETCLPIFYSSVGVVFCNLEAADVQFLAGAPDAGVAFLRKFQVGRQQEAFALLLARRSGRQRERQIAALGQRFAD